jgi:hypothetical protein
MPPRSNRCSPRPTWEANRKMRNLTLPNIDLYRDRSEFLRHVYGGIGDHTCGVFDIPSPIDAAPMHIIASSDMGWEHVSISRKNRCPNWPEMEFVTRLFFHPDEVAMQLHVAAAEHLSLHPYCLHLWRPNDGREIPLPPPFLVAPPMAKEA